MKNLKMELTEKNLVGSYHNSDQNTAELEFLVGGNTVWIKDAPYMDGVEVTEWYWDNSAIQYALENGRIVE